MGLGIDENRRAGRLVIGNPLYCQPVDVLLGGRKSMCLGLPKGENRGATRELERSSAGQCLSVGAIETAFHHEPIPAWRRGPTDNRGKPSQVKQSLSALVASAAAYCRRLAARGNKKAVRGGIAAPKVAFAPGALAARSRSESKSEFSGIPHRYINHGAFR